ncbi:phosphatidylinositol phosphate synthase [Corynebacterium kroppenstedtii]|uniref:phosphatidylinositol phosphate synthase n=1 Tax=Corynebacterium sp. PCR 32 TaxID=3351342 RepID=UPI003095D810
MLGVHGRKPAAVVIEPVARMLVKAGISPNTVTTLGTLGACAAALYFIPTGHLFAAAIIIGLVTAVDMVDGTMARLCGGGTTFGATLDASCDRITDGAVFAAIVWWIVSAQQGERHQLVAALIVLVTSQVISYVKARAEAGGLEIVGGLVERPERLIIGLTGLGLEGLGVPHVLSIALWVLAVGSAVTVVQRMLMASKSPNANEIVAAPHGANESPVM